IVAQMAAAGNKAVLSNWSSKLEENDATIAENMSALSTIVGDTSESWSDFTLTYANFLKVRDEQIIPLFDTADHAATYTQMQSAYLQPVIDAYVASLDAAAVEIQGHMDDIADAARARAQVSTIVVL